MRRDYRLFLKDIIDAMNAIEKFVAGMDFETFFGIDYMNGLVPLIDMYTHFETFFGIDYELLWNAIKVEIPKIKSKLKMLLGEMEESY